MKYFHLNPQGGFNDILSQIYYCIEYCIKCKRILLLGTIHSYYTFNFADYFTLNLPNIVYDNNDIQRILTENSSASSREIEEYICSLIENKIDYTEDILYYCNCGGRGDNYCLFYFMELKPWIKDYCKNNYLNIPKPYMAIQIRNKDYYNIDYKTIVYEKYKDIIHKQSSIYLATDDSECIEFFKSFGLNIYNFTTFPNPGYVNLHMTNGLTNDTKLNDLLSDLFICGLANTFISESKGLFTDLCKGLNEHKYIVQKLFHLDIDLPIQMKENEIFGFPVISQRHTKFGLPKFIITKSLLGMPLNIEVEDRELSLQEKMYQSSRSVKN